MWAALAVAAPAADGAQVRVDRSCYAPGETVQLTGTGFSPGIIFAISIDRVPLGGGLVDDAGLVGARFPAPAADGDFWAVVKDLLGRQGRERLRVARAAGSVTPLDGDPSRARFAVEGMGPGRPDVYLHWVAPGGAVRGPKPLGRAEGDCGALTTAPRRLFPTRTPARGTWRLQLDTRRTYSPRTVPRVVQRLTVR